MAREINAHKTNGDKTIITFNVIRSPFVYEKHICRIVEQMVLNGYINEFIDRFEYDMLCCEKGFEVLNNSSHQKESENV